MASKINYNAFGSFVEHDTTELEFFKVTNDIREYSKEKVIEIAVRYFREYGFPHYTVTELEKHEHMSALRKFDHNSILIDGNAIEQTMHGLRLAWSYFPHFWDVKCGSAKMSPMEIFHDDEQFAITMGKCYDWCHKHNDFKMTINRIRQSLKIYNGAQAVSNFRPTAAKLIYETHGGDGVVRDMSCGWGGRLIGALASSNVKRYIGTEPSTKTFEGLLQIRDDFSYIDKEIELYKLGSEEFRPERDSLDLCFTSPPYFDTEKYSDEETQSYKKFPTLDGWIDGFMRKTIDNCRYGLKHNGRLIINIADTSTGKGIAEDTVKLAVEMGFERDDDWNLILSSIAGKSKKYEPIFIFRKR